MKRVVIVGAGMAATRLVDELVARGANHRMSITVLGDEPHPPYNRILLSALLEGSHRPEALTMRDPEWYAEHGIDLRLGSRVLAAARGPRDVMLVDGATVPYDALVLATGSIPSLPPVRGLVRMDGSLHEAVHGLRSLADCERLASAVHELARRPSPDRRRAVVLGGGLLGLQVARALGTRGLATEVVEGADHLLHRQLGSAAGRVLARDLERVGVAVYTGARGVRLTDRRPDGRVALHLDTGPTLDADLVVLAAGGRPSTALARQAGVAVRRGVVVDDRLTSVSDPAVHALGDCAEHAGRTSGFVTPAWEQARVLASVLTGGPATYDGSRVVARLRATGLDVAVLGDPEREAGDVVEVSNPVRGSHRKLVVRGGRVVAGAFVGDLDRIGLITQHYDRRTVLGPTEPGDLLRAEATGRAPVLAQLPDDAEVCSCAGVTAGALRACASLEAARATTRATTGCGGCTPAVRRLVGERSSLVPEGAR